MLALLSYPSCGSYSHVTSRRSPLCIQLLAESYVLLSPHAGNGTNLHLKSHGRLPKRRRAAAVGT